VAGAVRRAGTTAEPPTTTPWTPTHDVITPLQARTAPDPTLAPVATLAPGVQLRLLERLGDWGHVEGSNGWRGWVDARQLVART
jgi:SH3-like domain-containing protein